MLVRADPGAKPEVVSPPGTSVRSRVHEYGGGAWCLVPGAGEGAVAYVEDSEPAGVRRPRGRTTRWPSAPPARAAERWRHGGLVGGPGRSVLAVRERRAGRPVRALGGAPRRRPRGPRPRCVPGATSTVSLAVSPEGDRLAWVLWDHPNMPWDETELWTGELTGAGVAGASAGRRRGRSPGPRSTSPSATDDGTLCFVADAGGWWQPWRQGRGRAATPPRARSRPSSRVRPGRSASTPWSTLGGGRLGLCRGAPGCGPRGHPRARRWPVEQLAPALRGRRTRCAPTAAAWPGWARRATSPAALWWCPAGGEAVALSRAGRPSSTPPTSRWPSRSRSSAAAATFPPPSTRPGGDGWAGPRRRAPAARRPLPRRSDRERRCRVRPRRPDADDPGLRGGCRSTTPGAPATGGTTAGPLAGRWGIDDVDDCVAVAGVAGRARPGRRTGMAIRGTSAGGFTALGALGALEVILPPRCRWYGISDLAALAETTHDFESRYTERLVGHCPPTPPATPSARPLNHLDDLHGAVLLLQGEEDPVVPLEQTTSPGRGALGPGRALRGAPSSPASPTASAGPRPSPRATRPSSPSTSRSCSARRSRAG